MYLPIHLPTGCTRRTSVLLTVLFLATHCVAQQTDVASNPPTIDPAKVFAEKCARCHGDTGQGVADAYDQPLAGTQDFDELFELIVETMPEEDPEQCVGEEARRVAQYILEELSNREEKPAITLTRLTVDQYRNAISDTIGRFAPGQSESSARESGRRRGRSASSTPLVRGLRGEYFQSRGMSKADRLAFYRSDTQIAFDFGNGSPAPTILPDQFSIVWEGGLMAKHTGHYEFRISTQNGARLYLNLDSLEGLRKLRDDSSAAGQQALIDGWVSSGKMRQLRARVFLLGGRTYPLRLEFFKYLEKTASIKFEWKQPHGTWAVLDHSYTQSVSTPRVYVCETPFPADDRSLGYERGSSVSPEWQSATTSAALAAAQEVIDRLPILAELRDEPGQRPEQVKDFVLRFARTAFRRPLTEDEREQFSTIVISDPANIEAGVRQAVVTVLLSPHFLYTDVTPVGEVPTPHAVASRLSFALWDSIPDRSLIEAADKGELKTAEQIERQAKRMMSNPRARAKMRTFFHHWLELEDRDLAKDKSQFPAFDEKVVADLRRSLESFIESIVWSRDSDYRELLLADYLILNDSLRELYASDLKAEEVNLDAREIRRRAREVRVASEFQPIKFPAARRSGVLTHPYLLSAYAYHNNTSPIHRGVFLTRNIVGRALSPPPVAVAFKDDEFAPDLTMREKITQLTRDKACMSCHSVINPLGFALESYDAVGRWRTTDKDKPVDTRGEYTTETGKTLEFTNARDIAKFAISHKAAHQAFVTQVFQHLVKQNPMGYGDGTIDRLSKQFAEDEFNIRNLWIRIGTIAAEHGTTDSLAQSERHAQYK